MGSRATTSQQQILDFYSRPGAMTSAGKHAATLDKLPRDVATLVDIVQALTVHEYVAGPFYGFTIPNERKAESHIRGVDRMLDRVFSLDGQPLVVPRPVEKRVVGVCHHFVLLLIAMMRAKGIPARARYGFGSYFNPGFFEDHSICEYWDAGDSRWVLVDPQFDEVWRAQLRIDHNVLDVPRDQFLAGPDAWTQWRAGEADASKFGIFRGRMRGAWFIAGVLIRDLAALNKMEMLQWDAWGAMPPPDQELSDEQMAFFDQLAVLTREPDVSFGELRRLYEGDERLRVPATVMNGLLNRQEAV